MLCSEWNFCPVFLFAGELVVFLWLVVFWGVLWLGVCLDGLEYFCCCFCLAIFLLVSLDFLSVGLVLVFLFH